MSEAAAWGTIRGHLQGLQPRRLHIQRFEDKLTAGIPDTNVAWNGYEWWMEGKYVKDLPVRSNSPVKLPHYTPQQCLWLETRQRAGCCAFLWIRVRDYGWLLFTSRYRALYDGMPMADFTNEPVYSSAKELVTEMACFAIKHGGELERARR